MRRGSTEASAASGHGRGPCGSCRAPARLRKRWFRQPLFRQCRRFRSLAKARQLPKAIGEGGVRRGSTEASATCGHGRGPCGSCRAPARLRKRWFRRQLFRQCRRLRSLAKARQLPQGIGGGLVGPCAGDQPKPRRHLCIDAIRVGAVEPRRGCESGGSGDNYFGSAAAFAASLKLDSSHRGSGAGLKGACAGRSTEASAASGHGRGPCGSCRAPARLRKRWFRQQLFQQCRRLRSLAKARQLPQGVGGGLGRAVRSRSITCLTESP